MTTQRCPQCGAQRSNSFRLNHVHDGVVVPWENVGGPEPLDISGRFPLDGAEPEAKPAPARRGRPRKTP